MFKAAEFARDTLESYRPDQPHAVWINLNPDDPFSGETGSSNSRIKDSISFFDLYVSWSRRLTSQLNRKGCKRAEYLPFGYDPDFHLPPGTNISSQGQYISFVGAWDKQREALLEKLVAFDLRIFGSSWSRVSKKSPLFPKITARNIYGKELSEVIFHSRASLNLLRPQNLGAHNMRTFEIPAMAGLMLTTRSREQQEYFPENEACLMFDTTDELSSQISRLLADGTSATAMRSKGHALVKNHSYIERAKSLLKMANAV
jgi:spore maturation protein CgeB